jgi:hypothetical protein
LFEALRAAGLCTNEPDFSTTLAEYRDAVERGDPQPKEWEWLGEMYERVINGKALVPEAEYRKLANWYEQNESVVCRVNLRFSLRNSYSAGPRRIGATKTVEEVRLIRAPNPKLKRRNFRGERIAGPSALCGGKTRVVRSAC